MLALLDALKPGHAILLVEHDMDAVFRVADRITVMVNGAVIASARARFPMFDQAHQGDQGSLERIQQLFR